MWSTELAKASTIDEWPALPQGFDGGWAIQAAFSVPPLTTVLTSSPPTRPLRPSSVDPFDADHEEEGGVASAMTPSSMSVTCRFGPV